ncbi:aminomethyl-transferring glycine dehydrogenase subunit GcvPA [Candidatus Avelusimicrobium luingense]|uniref:aminomethyl-transferring glycine dehydrogenase subunit GcvPA n=1 Tax=Candidatus Avelusimicrobium luingense TaxID=3416211 RepID=UPI003D0CD810
MFTPHTSKDEQEMLDAIGVPSIHALLQKIPADLLYPKYNLPAALTEQQLTAHMHALAAKNKPLKNFIGAGAYSHFIPAAVPALSGRGEFLTAYTPYQAEASQGTLQTIYEFQSCMCALFDMDVATASHYDGATALAEAVLAAHRITGREEVIVSGLLHPHYKEVLDTYTRHSAIRLTEAKPTSNGTLDVQALKNQISQQTACVVISTPNFLGYVEQAKAISQLAHEQGALLVAQVNPMSLGVLQTPGSYDADFAVAEGQPLGNPVSFGGPGLGIMTAKKAYMRQLPGRMVGIAKDKNGRRAFVLTLQAREQHIRREKAASNICSNEAICALNAVIYLTLLGPQGLKEVASLNVERAHQLADRIHNIKGFNVLSGAPFFNEFVVFCPVPAAQVIEKLAAKGIAAGYDLGKTGEAMKNALLVCATELTTPQDIAAYASALEEI